MLAYNLSGARCRLHTAQLMPLPLTASCFSKIQIGFTFLVLAHPGSPGKGPLNVCVWVWHKVAEHLIIGRELWRWDDGPQTRHGSLAYCSSCAAGAPDTVWQDHVTHDCHCKLTQPTTHTHKHTHHQSTNPPSTLSNCKNISGLFQDPENVLQDSGITQQCLRIQRSSGYIWSIHTASQYKPSSLVEKKPFAKYFWITLSLWFSRQVHTQQYACFSI